MQVLSKIKRILWAAFVPLGGSHDSKWHQEAKPRILGT